MNIPLNKNSSQTVICSIKPPNSEINKEVFNKFLNTLTNSDFLIRITQKTKLIWIEPSLNIKYSQEAKFQGLDTIYVDYNRGERAVSSTIHEAFHLLLRQIKWTDKPIVKQMIKKYPELRNSSWGDGYKMEQMFAYLLQNEIYQDMSRDLNIDATKDLWSMDYITKHIIQDEFNSEFLKQLASTIIVVWNSSNKTNDIFELIEKVENTLTKDLP